jgi:uncharacterized SAM-binding protein YcdF (DUF218 family)
MTKAELDAVVALGKNWDFSIEGKRIYLSLESKLTALAAAELYVRKKVKKIIYSGGETAGLGINGKPFPSEAEEMKKFIRIFFKKDEIPDKEIILEEKSIDTAGNAEEVGKIIKAKKFENIGLLTVGFHLPRAKEIFKNHKVSITEYFSSEEVLKNKNLYYDNLINDYYWSTKYLTEIVKEAVGLGLVYTIDPKGKILREITSRTRGD